MIEQRLSVLAAQFDTVATRTSISFNTPTARGLLLHINVANRGGVATFTPKLEYQTIAGTWRPFWTAAAAIAANGDSEYLFFPGSGTATQFTETLDLPLPPIWRLVLTYAGTPPTDDGDTLADAVTLT